MLSNFLSLSPPSKTEKTKEAMYMYTSIAILISYDPRTQIYPPKLSDNYFSVFKRALYENYGQCCVCYTGSKFQMVNNLSYECRA